MFILVKYGDNQTLVCNPSCAVANLLKSIKKRAGYYNKNISLDLSDETGLVAELDFHRQDNASQHLQLNSVYVLVERQPAQPSDEDETASAQDEDQQNFMYVPLLENYQQLFPRFRVHLHEKSPELKRRSRNQAKSPNAGKAAKSQSNSNASNVASKNQSKVRQSSKKSLKY